MLGIEHYLLFITSCIIVCVAPGNDTLFVLGKSLTQGKHAGMMAVLGFITGSSVHTVLAAIGLSVILMHSAVAFNAIKWAGALYLAYLGIRMLLSKSAGIAVEGSGTVALRKVYAQAIITNLFNPKVALFYLAFLPQFIHPDNAFGVVPFVLLGITFIIIGAAWCLAIVWGSGYISRKLKRPRFNYYINKITGITFIGLGLNLLRTKSIS